MVQNRLIKLDKNTNKIKELDYHCKCGAWLMLENHIWHCPECESEDMENDG
jgi:Zn finger protein HypA/HybF involved in hydrogenase expression